MKRSWCFITQEKFEMAEVDAKRSLTYDDDSKEMWNSYEILGHCFAKKSLFKQSEYRFKTALDGLRSSECSQEVKASAAGRIMTVYKNVMGRKDMKQKTKKGKERSNETVPKLCYGRHKIFEKASQAIDLLASVNYGRGFYANKDIQTGDILIIEEPSVAMLNYKRMDTHCSYCYSRLYTPIPCDGCVLAMFCDEDCLAQAKLKFHERECKILPYLYDEDLGIMAPIAFRLLNKMKWNRIKSYLDNGDISLDNTDLEDEERSKEWSWKGKYLTQDYITTYQLTTNSTKRSFGDLFKKSVSAIYIAECLKKSGFFDSEATNEEVIVTASIVMRHLQGGGCNAYGINELVFEEGTQESAEVEEIGGAMYPTVSLANHSCAPNVYRYSVGELCVVRATRPIKKGSQIFDNYGPQFCTTDYENRQSLLSSQYRFDCGCIACSEKWPLYKNNKENFKFECPEQKCNEILTFNSVKSTKCPSCGKTEKYKTLIDDIIIYLNNFAKVLELIKSGEHLKALQILQPYIAFLDHHVIPPAKCIINGQESIKRCFLLEGNKYIIN